MDFAASFSSSSSSSSSEGGEDATGATTSTIPTTTAPMTTAPTKTVLPNVPNTVFDVSGMSSVVEVGCRDAWSAIVIVELSTMPRCRA